MERERDRRQGSRDRDRARDRVRHDGGTTYHTDRPGGESYRPGGISRARSRTPRSGAAHRRSPSSQDSRDRYGNRGGDRVREWERDRDRDRHKRDDYRDKDRDEDRSVRRSPPRRGYSPRRVREENNYRPTRSPVRETRRMRSPRGNRERTPMSAKRSREGSPADRRSARSPPSKRERHVSPRAQLRSPSPRRPFSPPRERYRPDKAGRRTRSRSPRDPTPHNRSHHHSPSPRRITAAESNAVSRTSSPQVHPSRVRQIPNNHGTNDGGSTKPGLEHELEKGTQKPNVLIPTGPKLVSRAPPVGPASSGNIPSTLLSAPTGPASTAARLDTAALFKAPSRPRGGSNGVRGNHSGYREYPSARRTSDAHGALRASFASTPPTGPRAGAALPPSGPAAYRSSSSTSHASSTNYQQRPQRFLNDLPSLVPGGRPRPLKVPPNTDKAKKLDLEAERLRRQIEEAEADKRSRLRDWERLQGEAEGARLGTDLAAERLRVLERQDFR